MTARYIIGLDASRSTIEQPTGTEIYSRLLMDALLERAPDQFSFRLYFNQAPRFQIQHPQAEIRHLPFPRLWTHGRLSLEMTLHPPSVLFVPAHVLPLIQPRRSVVTVHDLGYLYFPGNASDRCNGCIWISRRAGTRAVATQVLADSDATKRDLIERGMTRGPIGSRWPIRVLIRA